MPGDILELEEQLTFWVTSRPSMLPALDALPEHAVPCFGAADPYGIVGESPVIWTLREQLAFAAVANQHVLLLGESGSGKELGALAIHALSSRASKAMISRNAATLPSGIIDAELFGYERGASVTCVITPTRGCANARASSGKPMVLLYFSTKSGNCPTICKPTFCASSTQAVSINGWEMPGPDGLICGSLRRPIAIRIN